MEAIERLFEDDFSMACETQPALEGSSRHTREAEDVSGPASSMTAYGYASQFSILFSEMIKMARTIQNDGEVQ